MSKVNRNEPKRSKASESEYSLMEFAREFPDDAACLEHLWRSRFSEDGNHAYCPKCDRERKFHRVVSRPSWSCDSCGHHIHPTAGTIFHKSATSLQLWFYVMYVMTSTRCGVSAKSIEREIGVGYKTAWRMCNLIRTHLMEQNDSTKLTGSVEADEKAYGGKPKVSMTRGMYAIRGVHTQTIDGFFGNMKNGIAGNYHGVSVKWLQSYVNEYAWRYNHRDNGRAMFAELLHRAAVVEP
ncbi:MAG TPA: IS1595 family transposase [Solirubrobacteraceae bacterium]